MASYGDSAKSIYGAAEQGQAAADAAESGAIRGNGTELASQLAGKLAGLGGPAGLDAATSGVVSANGAGGANATLGTGSAALAQLLARGTAAQDEAALQPGIARSQGLADIRDVTLAGNKTLADQVAAATGQLPALVSGLRDQSATRQSNRAQAGETLRQSLEGRNLDLAKYADAKRISGLNAKTKADATVKVAQIKGQTVAAKDAKPSPSLSGKVGYVVDSNGQMIPNKDGSPHLLPGYKVNGQGQVVKTSTGKPTKVPTLTAKETQTYMGTAATVADNAKSGFTDPKGVTHPAISAAAALKEMRQEGVPDSIAIAAINRAYGTKFNPNGKLP